MLDPSPHTTPIPGEYSRSSVRIKKKKLQLASRPKTTKSSLYRRLMTLECSNPSCEHGFDIEAHHINPISKGGDDALWNVLLLCRYCHRSLGFHGLDRKKHKLKLFMWKCRVELRAIGFILDENEPIFKVKFPHLLETVRKARKFARFG
jgi:5-methylcytosine-specific restriction endonuclease McrA